MEEFQQLRRHVLEYQVKHIRRELSDEEIIGKQNAIREEAARLIARHVPGATFGQAYASETVAPGGVFSADVNLVARVKLDLARHCAAFQQQPP